MLSGLSSTSTSMFPSLAGVVTPDADDMAKAYERMQIDRSARVSGYHTELFDMHSAKDRKLYNELMVELTKKMQLLTGRVMAHERRILPRKDGSSGWFNYIEWIEFELHETPISTVKHS